MAGESLSLASLDRDTWYTNFALCRIQTPACAGRVGEYEAVLGLHLGQSTVVWPCMVYFVFPCGIVYELFVSTYCTSLFPRQGPSPGTTQYTDQSGVHVSCRMGNSSDLFTCRPHSIPQGLPILENIRATLLEGLATHSGVATTGSTTIVKRSQDYLRKGDFATRCSAAELPTVPLCSLRLAAGGKAANCTQYACKVLLIVQKRFFLEVKGGVGLANLEKVVTIIVHSCGSYIYNSSNGDANGALSSN